MDYHFPDDVGFGAKRLPEMGRSWHRHRSLKIIDSIDEEEDEPKKIETEKIAVPTRKSDSSNHHNLRDLELPRQEVRQFFLLFSLLQSL